ncbi:autotransporter adhesin SadA-like [Montipora foliosa]|uniref:autotransporter adhesin SadA-like n=1 Tax=Montipora foliosa TaxID=591990 RepID=UPI0035F1B843
MSYSNGRLPSPSSSTIGESIHGLPGVRFKLTEDEDYDINNKKLRNVAEQESNSGASTKQYVASEVFRTLKKDGTDQMNGLLDTNNSRIENVGPGRHGTADALTHLQLEAFYFDLNTNSANIEAQNPIDMKNKKISNLAEGTENSDAVNRHQLQTGLVSKADKTELNDYILKSGLTNNLDMKNNKIVNLKTATSGNDAINFTQLNNELSKYLHLTGGTMKGDIQCTNNSIYGIENVSNDTSAVNRKYVNDELKKKADLTKTSSQTFLGKIQVPDFVLSDHNNSDIVNLKYLDNTFVSKNSGGIMQNSIQFNSSLSNNKRQIFGLAPPQFSSSSTNKAYVDTQDSKSLKIDGNNKMTSNLDMNNFQISNVKNATHNQDAVTLKQVNDGIAAVSTQNIEYTDIKIAESHISTHENRENVLKYAMDAGELTADFGIQDADLITYSDSPHQINKKAFTMKIQKIPDGSNLFKGRFDFDLFKLIRDNFSNHYTVCLEIYFQKSPFYSMEFNSF